MTEEEAKIQLALGILPDEEFYKLASSSSDPTILKALAKAFSKQIIDSKFHADNITSAFLNNPHISQKLKEFVLLSRQLQTNNINVIYKLLDGQPRSKIDIKKCQHNLINYQKSFSMTIKEIKIQLALGSLPEDDKLKLANNKRTSKKILTMLSTDEYWYIRECIARNPNTPIEVLKKLSTDKDWNVRYWTAGNSSTPIDILEKLSTDEDWYIKSNVAKRILIIRSK